MHDNGPVAKMARSRPEFTRQPEAENICLNVMLKPMCSVAINIKNDMHHQKSSFSPLTITRHVSKTSPSEDVWQSGSSVQPKFSAANASMRRTAGTSPVIPLSSGVSLVAGTQPLCLGARN